MCCGCGPKKSKTNKKTHKNPTKKQKITHWTVYLKRMGVPSVAKWVNDPAHLWGISGSLAWCSGLKIPRCGSCGIGHNCGSDLISGPGTPYATEWPKKKKQRKKPWGIIFLLGYHYQLCLCELISEYLICAGHYATHLYIYMCDFMYIRWLYIHIYIL